MLNIELNVIFLYTQLLITKHTQLNVTKCYILMLYFNI